MAITRQDVDERAGLHPMQAALEAEGVTPAALARKLREELDALDTKFFAHEGVVREDREVIAWAVRAKARQDAQKLLGLYPEGGNAADGAGAVTVVLNVGRDRRNKAEVKP